MTKAELIAAIANEVNGSKASAERHLNATLSTILKTLKKGDTIPLVGFGTFSVVKRKARRGRHPQTGAALKIPATKVVKFSAGKSLREAVVKKRRK